jgi:Purple acid Phosphatase, N-terminal domain/Calcineurin-like phosphoesterase/TAT (twin-arginine translocation) pathway signal sequence
MSKISRRTFIKGAGATALAAAASPSIWLQPSVFGANPPEQLHLQFGSDASTEVVTSWATTGSVKNPRLRLGTRDGGFGRTIPAETRTYIDGKSGVESFTQHARIDNLEPDTHYTYEVLHEGAPALAGSFTTAPRGRRPVRFTSFGDQSTPVPGDGLWSPFAGYNPPQVEKQKPLFHLLNGDLCYANISTNPRQDTWRHFFMNNQVSARNRPWMPAAGNHENELNNGPFGYLAYQTRFSVPSNGESDPALRGMWYSFTAGSVRVISLNNDDVCYQDGGDNYISGYSQGAQKRFLERELIKANSDDDIDWIVIVMHQVAMSSVHNFNGADLGIRQQWLPLFDKYGVDLIVCGHEHHYERTKPVRGVDPLGAATLRPKVVSDELDVVDTSKGLVQMIIGGGGTSAPSNGLFYDPPQCDVIMSVGPQLPTPPGGSRPKRAPNKVTEVATWAGVRDHAHAYGFAVFDVVPQSGEGMTSIDVTFLGDPATVTGGDPTVFEKFRLTRPLRHPVEDDKGAELAAAR